MTDGLGSVFSGSFSETILGLYNGIHQVPRSLREFRCQSQVETKRIFEMSPLSTHCQSKERRCSHDLSRVHTKYKQENEYSENGRCLSHLSTCDFDSDRHSGPPTWGSLTAADFATKLAFNIETGQMDIERTLFGSQRIILQVQGMTCSGCENKLSRLLISFPEVSGLKTSLLRAQAEFDLRPSSSINAENIASTVQKMTGFTCTKMIPGGEELELMVDGHAQYYADSWPSSIISLNIASKRRIRVIYHPKVIGVRELLSDPFFSAYQTCSTCASTSHRFGPNASLGIFLHDSILNCLYNPSSCPCMGTAATTQNSLWRDFPRPCHGCPGRCGRAILY